MSFLVPLVIQNLTSFVIPTPYGSISFGIVDAFTILGVIGAIIYSVRSYNSQQTERKFQKLIEVYKMINTCDNLATKEVSIKVGDKDKR